MSHKLNGYFHTAAILGVTSLTPANAAPVAISPETFSDCAAVALADTPEAAPTAAGSALVIEVNDRGNVNYLEVNGTSIFYTAGNGNRVETGGAGQEAARKNFAGCVRNGP